MNNVSTFFYGLITALVLSISSNVVLIVAHLDSTQTDSIKAYEAIYNNQLEQARKQMEEKFADQAWLIDRMAKFCDDQVDTMEKHQKVLDKFDEILQEHRKNDKEYIVAIRTAFGLFLTDLDSLLKKHREMNKAPQLCPLK